MTYQIHDILKKNIIPKEVERTISLFRKFYIDTFKYTVFRSVTFKVFVENKGKFVPILSRVVNDKLLGVFDINNKFLQQPFYEEYNLEKNDIIDSLFEQTLVQIETKYREHISSGRTVSSAFKKALSFVLQTKQKFGLLHIAYKFFVSSFSFVHGTFRERNINLFHGEKKIYIKFGTFKNRQYTYTPGIYSGAVVYGVSNKPEEPRLVVHNKEHQIVEEYPLTNKERKLFDNLVCLFESYYKRLDSNPFIANVIYGIGLSDNSKKRIALNYIFEQNFIEQTIKSFNFKKKEYATDNAYSFRLAKGFKGNIHPVSMICHHDYVDYSVEYLDQFMKSSLTLQDSKNLFNFIDLFGADYTFDLLNFKENFGDLSETYEKIKNFRKIHKDRFVSVNNNCGNSLYSFYGTYQCEETREAEEIINNHWKEIYSLSSFRYLIKNESESNLIHDLIKKEFNNTKHIFWLSLLNMSGVNIHSLSFDDCFSYPIYGSLKGENLILEQNLLSFIYKNLNNIQLIMNRKQFLCVLYILKRMMPFIPENQKLNLFSFFQGISSIENLSFFIKKFNNHFSSFNRINLYDIQDFCSSNGLHFYFNERL